MTSLGRIDSIWRYPVSSMGGEQLSRAQIETGGIAGDRQWGLVDQRDGSIVNPHVRREWRPIPGIVARLAASGVQILVPAGSWLEAVSAQAQQAISNFLGFEADLLAHVPYGTVGRNAIAPRYQRASLLLLTTASMRKLAGLLGSAGEVDARRFRPNIVVETAADAAGFVEQEWIDRELAIGESVVKVREPCPRCPFVNLAQSELSSLASVLHTITQEAEGNFGVYCDVVKGGLVRKGDAAMLA